jgi:hypothetical protein
VNKPSGNEGSADGFAGLPADKKKAAGNNPAASSVE